MEQKVLKVKLETPDPNYLQCHAWNDETTLKLPLKRRFWNFILKSYISVHWMHISFLMCKPGRICYRRNVRTGLQNSQEIECFRCYLVDAVSTRCRIVSPGQSPRDNGAAHGTKPRSTRGPGTLLRGVKQVIMGLSLRHAHTRSSCSSPATRAHYVDRCRRQ